MIRLSNTQYFHFLQQADAFRRSGSLCDAIISVKTQTFRAHRLVLACASRRLARQLALGDTDGPVHCMLEYFSPHTFQQVLDFTYMQTLDVSEEDLLLLLRAAQLLEMQLLEDQCQKQLNMLHRRTSEENKTGEIIYVKEEEEEEEHPEQTVQALKGRRIQDKKRGETVNDALNSITVEDDLPSSKTSNSPQSTRKKPRLPPGSATPYSRDSVITRSTSSSTSSCSPWTVPNMLKSVSTLRHLAENYSSIVPVHPPQPPNQLPLPYPFPFTPPHLFPLLGSHFQSATKACSDFHYGCPPSLYAGSTEIGNIIKQGLLRRKKNCQRAFQTTKSSHYDVPKASTERLNECQHCSKSLLDDPVLRESAATLPGETCAGCQQQSHQQEHRGEKPYQCQHCPKKFSLKHQLDTHHRVHTGEKPFECRLCRQRSRDYSAMIKHLRTHGGASPYQCTVCLEFCSSLVAMQRHIKSHAEQDFPPDWSINDTYLYTSHI